MLLNILNKQRTHTCFPFYEIMCCPFSAVVQPDSYSIPKIICHFLLLLWNVKSGIPHIFDGTAITALCLLEGDTRLCFGFRLLASPFGGIIASFHVVF